MKYFSEDRVKLVTDAVGFVLDEFKRKFWLNGIDYITRPDHHVVNGRSFYSYRLVVTHNDKKGRITIKPNFEKNVVDVVIKNKQVIIDSAQRRRADVGMVTEEAVANE